MDQTTNDLTPKQPDPTDPKYERPVWYLPSPFYQYNEDVKMLARKAGLRIIDSTVTASRAHAAPASEIPVVTIKDEYKVKSRDEIVAEQTRLVQEAEQRRAAAAEASAQKQSDAQTASTGGGGKSAKK